MKKIKYDLSGEIEVIDWLNKEKIIFLCIHTDEEGYKKIKNNLLQDFVNYGYKKIFYADFDVYKSVVEEYEDKIITTEYMYPIDRIEAGNKIKIEVDDLIANVQEIYYD